MGWLGVVKSPNLIYKISASMSRMMAWLKCGSLDFLGFILGVALENLQVIDEVGIVRSPLTMELDQVWFL